MAGEGRGEGVTVLCSVYAGGDFITYHCIQQSDKCGRSHLVQK